MGLEVVVDLDNWANYRNAINTVRERRNSFVLAVLKTFMTNRRVLLQLYSQKLETITKKLMEIFRSDPSKIQEYLLAFKGKPDEVFFKEDAATILGEIAGSDLDSVDDSELAEKIKNVFALFQVLHGDLKTFNFEKLDFGNRKYYPFLLKKRDDFIFGDDEVFQVSFPIL